VPTQTLDEFAQSKGINQIDFLKIDVEDVELEVLKGASYMLNDQKINLILFEVNRPVLASIGKTIAPLYNFLLSKSYNISDLNGTSVSLKDLEKVQFGDCLACPKSD
jgi:hypothetical protein